MISERLFWLRMRYANGEEIFEIFIIDPTSLLIARSNSTSEELLKRGKGDPPSR